MVEADGGFIDRIAPRLQYAAHRKCPSRSAKPPSFEATLARIVLPETGIGASRSGPWTRAADAGLFSDKHVPLPHPPGTQVPQFRLTGVSEAFQGPFKLRELIGFASRRMLPTDALIQADGHTDWTPVTRIGILNACFNGELIPAVQLDWYQAEELRESDRRLVV